MAEPGKQNSIYIGTLMKNKYRIFIIILLQILFTACGKQPINSSNNLQNKNTLSLNSPNAPLTTPQNIPNANNTTNNSHNPFQANTNNANNSVTTPIQAINQYSVNDLQMVGTITTDSQLSALIQSPDGNTCTVTTGDKIGKENAEITSITAEQIILEITRDFNGSSFQQLIELTLNKQSAQSSAGISL